MKDNWKSLQRYAPWFFLLVGVDLLAALFLWIADIQAFYAVLTALALISVLMFAAVFLVVVRHERRKARAFERFINSPDEFEEEALLKLCSDAEKNEIRLLGQVLREKQEDVNQLLTRVSDYEEYVESWAHETKMPISLLTFLLDNRKDEIPESVSFKLDYIRNRMQEYTNQMLFYARLKGVRKDYLFEHLYVRDCLDDVLEDYRPLLEEKGMEQQYKKELEYLAFEHLYFVPSKEVVLKDRNNPCLKEWRSYLDLQYPDWKENPYIRQLSGKDKILLLLLRHRCYAGMCMLSVLRKGMDRLKNK